MAYDFKRVFRLDRASRVDARASVDEELQHHLELATEELAKTGWDPDDAHREAVRRFGDLEETTAYCAEVQTRRGRESAPTPALSFCVSPESIYLACFSKISLFFTLVRHRSPMLFLRFSGICSMGTTRSPSTGHSSSSSGLYPFG
jgi:hypothetical protein